MSSSETQNGRTAKVDPKLPIAIVGGGLGGLALAVGLLKRGVNIHIYESAQEFSEIGAGVSFGPNSTTALKLIDEALLEGYKKHATFNEDASRQDTFMVLRWGMDEKKQGGKKAGDLMGYIEDKWNPERAKKIGVRTRSAIHRARLLDVLVSFVPEGITSFGKSFEAVEEQPDGSLELRFADGSIAVARALIGCDGVKSKVRPFVCGPDVDANYVGEYAYRALVPKVEAVETLGADLALNGQLYCGYGRYIVTYPVEHGDFTNMVACWHEAGTEWTWEGEDWTEPTTREEFQQHFEAFYPPLTDLIRKHCQPFKWALFNTQHPAPYYKGRICLLGDSAHATTPHMGAGAGMAMEDAYILSNLIASAEGSVDIENVFRVYDSVRRPRTQKLVECSRNSGLLIDFLVPDVLDDTEAMTARMEEWYKWLWHEDLEAQLEHAKTLL